MVDQGVSAGNGLRRITKAIHATRRRPTVPGSRCRLSHTIKECADLQQVLRAHIEVLGSDLRAIAAEYGTGKTHGGGSTCSLRASSSAWS